MDSCFPDCQSQSAPSRVNQQSERRILTEGWYMNLRLLSIRVFQQLLALLCSRTYAKCRDIHDDHNKREKVQSHQQSYGRMHRQNTTEPNTARFFNPNKNRITDLEQTYRDSEHRQDVFESNKNIGRNETERRPD